MAAQRLIYVVRDAKNAAAQVVSYLPATTTLAEAAIENAALAPIVDDLIGGYISGISLNIPLAIPGGVKTAAVANSDVEEGARFVFSTGTGYNTALRLPTFLETFLVSNSRAVDLTAAEVIAFRDYMLNGSGGAIAPTDYRGDDISGLVSALESFQRSRRTT